MIYFCPTYSLHSMDTNRQFSMSVHITPSDRIDHEQTMTTPVRAEQREGKCLLRDRLPPAAAPREIQVSRFLMREIISIVHQYFLSFLSVLLTRVQCYLNSWPTFNLCLHLNLAIFAKHKPRAAQDETTKDHLLSDVLNTRRINPYFVTYGINLKTV